MSDNLRAQTSNVVNIFDQYSGKAKNAGPTAPEVIPPANPGAYKAFGVNAPQGRSSSMITIHYGNGVRSILQKSFLQECLVTSDQYLSMIFTNCIITVEGEYLDQLADLIEEEKISSLHCFDPKIHDRPQDGKIFISNITRRSARDPGAIESKKGAR